MLLKKTTDLDSDFLLLVKELDTHFYKVYGDLQKKYAPNNILKTLYTVLVGYIDNEPIACGCFREFEEGSVEIKRMFVKPTFQGKGYAKILLKELEKWAKELGFQKAVLETGIKQPEAIGLYKHLGYKQIPNYGAYKELRTSICMEKVL